MEEIHPSFTDFNLAPHSELRIYERRASSPRSWNRRDAPVWPNAFLLLRYINKGISGCRLIYFYIYSYIFSHWMIYLILLSFVHAFIYPSIYIFIFSYNYDRTYVSIYWSICLSIFIEAYSAYARDDDMWELVFVTFENIKKYVCIRGKNKGITLGTNPIHFLPVTAISPFFALNSVGLRGSMVSRGGWRKKHLGD